MCETCRYELKLPFMVFEPAKKLINRLLACYIDNRPFCAAVRKLQVEYDVDNPGRRTLDNDCPYELKSSNEQDLKLEHWYHELSHDVGGSQGSLDLSSIFAWIQMRSVCHVDHLARFWSLQVGNLVNGS